MIFCLYLPSTQSFVSWPSIYSSCMREISPKNQLYPAARLENCHLASSDNNRGFKINTRLESVEGKEWSLSDASLEYSTQSQCIHSFLPLLLPRRLCVFYRPIKFHNLHRLRVVSPVKMSYSITYRRNLWMWSMISRPSKTYIISRLGLSPLYFIVWIRIIEYIIFAFFLRLIHLRGLYFIFYSLQENSKHLPRLYPFPLRLSIYNSFILSYHSFTLLRNVYPVFTAAWFSLLIYL